jgi:hypothetical protein
MKMKRSVFRWLGLATLFVVATGGSKLRADMDVILGEVIPFSGPSDLATLNFPGNVVYAIDVWSADGVDREVKGVLFRADNGPEPIPGYRTDLNQNVTAWQNKPEYGDAEDDDNLEEIMHHIRWTENPGGESLGVHFEVAPNTPYTLQLLISGNHQENRKWDIYVEDEVAVEDFDSNADQTYDQSVSYAYTYSFTAADDELNVTFNQDRAANPGVDGNGILQAAILALAGEAVTPGDFNSDDKIDVADFQILANHFHNTGASFFDGDMNFDSTIDLSDFVAFRAAYLAANPAGAAVPEPGGVLSLMCAGSLLWAFFRRRCRRT